MATKTFAAECNKTVTIAGIVRQTAPVKIINGLNLTEAKYGTTTKNTFPAEFNVNILTTPEITVKGKPDPTITIDYENCNEPTVTNTSP